MSLKGSPRNWWKEKRQSSHSGIPAASRPATAFPWASISEDDDLKKIVQDAVFAAFESDAFKLAIASQVDPILARQQEKLNQIKTANLNLESTLQAFVEELPATLEPIHDRLSALVIPEYGSELEALSKGQKALETQLNDVFTPNVETRLEALSKGQKTLETQLNDVFTPNVETRLEALSTKQKTMDGKLDDINIPNYAKELNDISTGQTRMLRLLESRFSSLEDRIEEIDRKVEALDESAVNSDLRSALRFGELSNELQDRNTMLGNRIWEVERDLGKKIDAQQRKNQDVYEEMGKASRTTSETLATIQANMNGDRLLLEVQKANSRAETAEKASQRHIVAIQEQVGGIETSITALQTNKIDVIDVGISEIKKGLETSRKLSSSDSKLLSTNTSKLDAVMFVVGQIQNLAESTNETTHQVSKSQQASEASATKERETFSQKMSSLDRQAVSHTQKLEDTIATITQLEKALVAFDASTLIKLESLESSVGKVEQELAPMPSHFTKLDDLKSVLGDVHEGTKPHQKTLNDLTTSISDMRAHFGTLLSSHDVSLDTVRRKVEDTSSVDKMLSNFSSVPEIIEQKLSSSLSTVRIDTSKILKAIEEAQSVRISNQAMNSDSLESAAHAITLIKDDITSFETKILQSLEINVDKLEQLSSIEPVLRLSEKVEEISTSILAEINHSHKDLQSASKSTTEEINHHIETLYKNLQMSFESTTKAADARLEKLDVPIATILDEFRTLKAVSADANTKVDKELKTIKLLAEVNQSEHAKGSASILSSLENVQRLHKDEEILTRLESWQQGYLSKSTSDTAVVTELLDASRERDEAMQASLTDIGKSSGSMFEFIQSGDMTSSTALQKLDFIRSILEDKDEISCIKQNNLEALRVLNEIQLGVKCLTEDSTAASTKELLLQNISSMAIAQEGVTAINANIAKSEDSISSTIRDNQTELQNSILAAVSSATTSTSADLSDIRKDFDTKMMIATGTLTTEIRGVDSAEPLKNLRGELHSSSMAMHDSIKQISDGVESRLAILIGHISDVVNESKNDHTRTSQENLYALTQLQEGSNSISASITQDLAETRETFKLINQTGKDIGIISSAIEKVDETATRNAEIITSIHDFVSRIDSHIVEVARELTAAVDTSGSDTLQAVKGISSAVREVHEITNDLLPKLRDEIKAVDLTLEKTASESHASKTAIISSITSTSASIQDTNKATGSVQESILLQVQSLRAALISDFTTGQETLQRSMKDISDDLTARLVDSATKSNESKKTFDTNFTTMTQSIHDEAENARSILEALRSHVVSELNKMDSAIGSVFDGVKADIKDVSSEMNGLGSSIRGEIKQLDSKSTKSFAGIGAAIEQAKTDVFNSVEKNSSSSQSSFDSVSDGMGAIVAAVRVNSAAIARVDKAVLETGSQVKAVVHDGTREVMSQLDEQLFDSGTRIKGLSNFDIPRIEAIGKQNKDILEVIGTRVVGTKKRFEELMALHTQKSPDHTESLSGRRRGGSNTSSSRDSLLRMATK